MRDLFKYSTYYSGKEPEFKEGDIFRIIVQLNAEMDGETTKGGGQGGGQGSGRAADEDKLWTNDLSEVLTGDITTCRDVAHRQRSSPRREGSFCVRRLKG